MLTNLSWLDVGQDFPPQCENKRLKMYYDNKELFECEHSEVYKKNLERIERIIGNFNEIISYPVVLNFQKLMSLKIADLLLGEPPIFKCDQQDTLNAIIKNSDLINTAYQTAIDVSRYGDGLLYIRNNGTNGVIDITQPPIWFPIVSCDNVKDIQYHVLAWTYYETQNNIKKEYLKVQIHCKGSYEERIYLLVNRKIMKLVADPEITQTGLTDFAIIQIPNVLTSDRVTGIDDYTDVDSIICELMVRVGQVARILDKHANPSMTGPATALERDEVTGEFRLKVGNFFPRDSSEDAEMKYVTWDGQLTANFTQIEKLVNFLYTISEMGSALFGDMTGTTGQVSSGTALKRLMSSPLAKVARIRSRFDPAIKKAIVLCSQLGGKGIVNLTDVDISINWQDGLAPDFKEDADILALRTGNKATMSQKRALMMFDGMSEDDADEELALIQDDEAITAPFKPAPTFGG